MTEPTTIEPSELAYHETLIQGMYEAREAQQEIARLQQIAGQHEAAFVSWAKYLHEKYALGVGDQVEEDGRISRSPVTERNHEEG